MYIGLHCAIFLCTRNTFTLKETYKCLKKLYHNILIKYLSVHDKNNNKY